MNKRQWDSRWWFWLYTKDEWCLRCW